MEIIADTKRVSQEFRSSDSSTLLVSHVRKLKVIALEAYLFVVYTGSPALRKLSIIRSETVLSL